MLNLKCSVSKEGKEEEWEEEEEDGQTGGQYYIVVNNENIFCICGSNNNDSVCTVHQIWQLTLSLHHMIRQCLDDRTIRYYCLWNVNYF